MSVGPAQLCNGARDSFRLGNTVTLRVVDAHPPQHRDDLFVLGEFGNRLLAGQVANLVNRTHHFAIDRIMQDFLDETPIDFQEINREVLQVTK